MTRATLAVLSLAGVLLAHATSAPAMGAPGAWSATGALNDARSSHTVTRLPSGELLAAGGVRADRPIASAERYDPEAGAGRALGGLSAARLSHTATRLPDGRVVVVGGEGADGEPLASTEIYDPATGSWSAGGELSAPRSSHVATLLGNGRILVAGGAGSDGLPLASAEVYDPGRGTWAATGSLAAARTSHTATVLANGVVLVAGGTGAGTRRAVPVERDVRCGSRHLVAGAGRHLRTASARIVHDAMPMELKAVLLNCTIKKSPAVSNTQALMDKVVERLEALDVVCETVRVADHDVRFGVSSDEGDGDEWPKILDKVLAADILVIGTPIWFGVRSSVCQMVIERLDGTYNTTNEVGQYPLYNTVGGVVVTGNEDGAHDAASNTLFNLSHLGCTIPPNSDTYWLGDAGPGPSYIEAGGEDHAYTQKTTSWMAHNLVHLARMLKERPIPPEGNTVPGWQPDDCRGHEDRGPAGHVG